MAQAPHRRGPYPLADPIWWAEQQLKVPVKFIGLGETPQDIETFDPQRFVEALFGAEPAAAR